MKKIRLWFVYEPVTEKGKLSGFTKKVINLVKKLEKSFDKNKFDLKSIDYSRFLSESDIKVYKSDLPAVIINNRIAFAKRLPSVEELNRKITELK